MSLSVGIVGLPNSGKSTLFNALLKRQIAKVAEYPYTTIEPNVGAVEVPDERLDKITSIANINKKVPASVKFIDIAGLIKNAHKGEGLGNQFLGHIREADAVVHILRAFQNEKVSHVNNKIDPIKDVEDINFELEMAGIKKPTIYVLNVSESDLKQDFNLPFKHVKVSAKLEAELSDLSGSEQKDFLRELDIEKSGLDQVIAGSYKLLNLITFFTIAGGKQAQAWPIKNGANIIDAANLVHTDFSKKFIKAEVVSFDEFVNVGGLAPRSLGVVGWKGARANGKSRLGGRDYIVQDGDVIEFKIGS